MRNDFSLFVTENYSPDVQDYIKKAFELFEALDIEEYDLNFSAILMDETERTDEKTDLFYKHVRDLLLLIVSEFEIELIEDIQPGQLLAICEALTVLPNYTDPTQIMTLVEGSITIEETFCDCLALVSEKTAVEFGAFIESVPQSFLDNLYSYFKDKDISEIEIDNEDATTKEKQDIIQKLKAFKQFINYDEAVGFEMIRDGTDVGHCFEHYAAAIKKHMDILDIATLGKEISVVLLMAKDTFRNPLMAFSERANMLFEDINRLTQLDIVLRATFASFDKYCGEIIASKGPTNEQV